MPFPLQVFKQHSTFPLLFCCPLEYGICHLIQDLDSSERPLIWLELDYRDQEDAIWLGNHLAEAINKVFDTRLLNSFSYEYALVVLKTLLPQIGPITLAVTQAHLVRDFVQAVLKLHGPMCRVVLQIDHPLENEDLPDQCVTLDLHNLSLKPEQALALLPPLTDETFALDLWKKAQGAYDLFLSLYHQHFNLPPHVFPGPSGPRTLKGFEIESQLESMLKVFIRKQHWLEALEVACKSFPEDVPNILVEAGHCYHEQGLHKRLFHLLEYLPEQLKRNETVLYWRLQAAFRLGCEQQLRKDVTVFLKKHEAPELRALAAGVYVPTNRKEALRAYKARKTSFTTYQLARLTYGEAALKLFQESIQLAKEQGKPYEVARNMGSYAASLTYQGRYQDGVSWAEEALKVFDQLNLKDGQRRLYIFNDFAYARLMCGNLKGLEALLQENETLLTKAYPELAMAFRSTLAEYYLIQNNLQKALDYYQLNVDLSSQEFAAYDALDFVTVLMALGHHDDARKTAQRAYSLTSHMTDHYSLRGLLAYAITHMSTQPILAREYLIESKKGLSRLHDARRIAQASLYLALSYFQNGDLKKCQAVLHDPKSHIANLSPSALRLVSGPESLFKPIWNLLEENKLATLELKLLGKKEVWFEGKPVTLFRNWLEILTILAIERRPLELEELMAYLYGDTGNKKTLKAHLSKMRRVLPISLHPYYIQGSFKADFINVEHYLNKGQFAEAVRHYSGPFLRLSESPCIRAKDEELTESLCRLALESSDVESLLHLTEVIPDDLRLMDKLLQLLNNLDC